MADSWLRVRKHYQVQYSHICNLNITQQNEYLYRTDSKKSLHIIFTKQKGLYIPDTFLQQYYFSLCPILPHILYSYIRLNNIILLHHDKFLSFQPSYNIALLLQKRLYHTPKRSLSHVHTGFLAYRKRLCRMLKKHIVSVISVKILIFNTLCLHAKNSVYDDRCFIVCFYSILSDFTLYKYSNSLLHLHKYTSYVLSEPTVTFIKFHTYF